MSAERPPSDELRKIIENLRLVVFDFDGVFTDNTVLVFQDGREAVRCSRFDGLGLRRLETCGVEPLILSAETNPVVSARSKKLKTERIQGCENKVEALLDLLQKRGISVSDVAFVGNDINDLGCLRMVALPIIVADSHPDVISFARHRTIRRGGEGAVREVCDWIAGIREAARTRSPEQAAAR